MEAWFIETALACAMGRAQLKDAYPLLADYRLETHGVESGQDTGRKAAYQCGISNEAGSDEETLQIKVQ